MGAVLGVPVASAAGHGLSLRPHPVHTRHSLQVHARDPTGIACLGDEAVWLVGLPDFRMKLYIFKSFSTMHASQ